MKHLVPPDFVVPLRLETPDFVLRPLLITDVVKDYDAVMTSVAQLQSIFSRQTRWPEGLSFEDDLIDLGWHHKEFKVRRSFAYTVMSYDKSICLGCVYINPTDLTGYDAEAFCWARSSHPHLDQPLYQVLKSWLQTDWPFAAVAYPGRTLTWDEVESLKS
ncbi:hypothetical protein JKL49_19070 [Phenylobacterium sp. 20VBR1]|uniref:Uncharacterized protein n=1 Tax=Phenylobacterium glaciei TaxID=2803784 RepID=A0A941D3M4_9CAUL|nr:hypothetical protein [Phenylobacterium glaciei]MBR7621501.1 hypothetical protein [Phenylobacterium glaciei]QQZ50245.1 hypothetical protein JKL49_00400 [Phenylobacterium glaciei]